MVFKYINIIYSYIKLIYNLRKLIKGEIYNDSLVKKIVCNVKDAGAIAIKLAQWSIPKLEMTYNNKLWIKDCEQLYDNCNIHPLDYTNELYETIFNHELETEYDILEILGSGSIGQVYKIKDKETNEISVMKVRHPNIDKELSLFKIIYRIVSCVWGKKIRNVFPFDIGSFIESFERQMNFINESNNLLFFTEMYKDNDMICIPKLKKASDSIILMSYEESINIDNRLLKNLDKIKLINLLFLFIRNNESIINVNHGDLHKGNWGYRDNKLVIYDFGYCYEIERKKRELVILIPETFDSENLNTLEENRKNIKDIMIGIINSEINEEERNKINDLVDSIFTSCDIFKGYEDNKVGSPDYMLEKVIEFCKNNNKIVDSRLLNFFILFLQCKKFYLEAGVVEEQRTSHDLYIGRYVDVITFCKTYNIFNDYAKFLIGKMNKYNIKRESLFDSVKYDDDMNNELLALINKEK